MSRNRPGCNIYPSGSSSPYGARTCKKRSRRAVSWVHFPPMVLDSPVQYRPDSRYSIALYFPYIGASRCGQSTSRPDSTSGLTRFYTCMDGYASELHGRTNERLNECTNQHITDSHGRVLYDAPETNSNRERERHVVNSQTHDCTSLTMLCMSTMPTSTGQEEQDHCQWLSLHPSGGPSLVGLVGALARPTSPFVGILSF